MARGNNKGNSKLKTSLNEGTVGEQLRASGEYQRLTKRAKDLTLLINKLEDKYTAMENRLPENDKTTDKLNKVQGQIASLQKAFFGVIEKRDKGTSLNEDIDTVPRLANGRPDLDKIEDPARRREVQYRYSEVGFEGNGFVENHPLIPGGAYTRYIAIGSATHRRFAAQAMDAVSKDPAWRTMSGSQLYKAINLKVNELSGGKYTNARWSIKQYPD